ncbi:class I SAM-dependent methyltransferase [Streptomyces sp. NPDC058299]|uniref:class I SAM-dependent methyltransferase n=1 Tax=Streptomyces sp. NPDC058299 TaxID=3346435 RepID=UPI0036ED310E
MGFALPAAAPANVPVRTQEPQRRREMAVRTTPARANRPSVPVVRRQPGYVGTEEADQHSVHLTTPGAGRVQEAVIMMAGEGALGRDTCAAADAYRGRDMRLAERLIFPAVLRRLGGGSGPGRPALDAGCGTGADAVRLAGTEEWTVRAVDPSAGMLDIARADRPHPRVSLPAVRWPSPGPARRRQRRCRRVLPGAAPTPRTAGRPASPLRTTASRVPARRTSSPTSARRRPAWPSPRCGAASRTPCTATAAP